MNSFTILGSSSGMPQPDRACSSHVLQVGESLNLIDCGGGAVSSFLRNGFDPRQLDRVFISHTHSDHVGDLALLIQMLHGVPTERPLDVYLPDEFVAMFESYLKAVYLIRERLKMELRLHGYTDGFVFEDKFKLTAIANGHLLQLNPDLKKLGLSLKMQCHSFLIEAGDKRLFYSADIASFEEIKQHLSGLDYAIIEAMHIDVDELLDFARTANVKQYILTHYGGGGEAEMLQRLISESGLNHVRLATDGMRLDL